MDNWSDPFHSCCRSARHNNFILNTAITNRGAVELVDLMDIGKCISATKQEILLPFIQKYFWFLGSQRNMQFHFQQAGKKSSPTKVTRHRGAQYGKHFPSYPHFPSVAAKSAQNNQHSYQNLPLLLQTLHLPVTTSVLRAGSAHRQPSRAAAELREPGPWGAALGMPSTLETNKPLNHSKYPLVEKLKNNFKTTPGVIYNKLQKEMLL